MRTFVWALLLGCSLAGAVGAAEKPLGETDLQEFRGQYDLADGRTLTVTQHRKKLLAQINGGPAVELEPVGKGVFMTRWGGLRVEFDQRDNGNVAGVRLSGPEQVARRQD